MRQRIVLWGLNEANEKVLIAAALEPSENKVVTTVFPADGITEEFVNSMMKSWRAGHDIPFPMGYLQFEKDLTVSEPMIPENIKVEREDVLKRAQTEWNFTVLSHKMFDAFDRELDDLKEKVGQIASFESGLWEELKGFWSKVQHQIRERNLVRFHSDQLRKKTNDLFDNLKSMRKKQDQEFKRVSDTNKAKFQSVLEEIEEKVEKGLSLQPLFDQLKKLQKELKDSRLTRDHRDKIWTKLDGLFKVVKEKRYGRQGASGNSPLQRLERRYEGLITAVEKMERSIERDQRDLKYQLDHMEDSGGQLEMEMRKAKVKIIEERINSKNHKLEEMIKTRTTLESRIEKEKVRAAKREEETRIAEEKAKIKEQLKADFKTTAIEASDAEKLEQAAEAINTSRRPADKEDKPKQQAATSGVGPSDDVIKSAAALAAVVSGGTSSDEEE